jgi:hypothetical protein
MKKEALFFQPENPVHPGNEQYYDDSDQANQRNNNKKQRLSFGIDVVSII